MRQGLRITIGCLTILCVVVGLYYNAVSVRAALRGGFDDISLPIDAPFILPAFYAMSAVCVVCLVLLGWGGYHLIRGAAWAHQLLTGVWLFEIVYFVGVGASWVLADRLGPSIGAASGIANGGLMVQFLILLPLWGPIVLFLLNRSTRSSVA